VVAKRIEQALHYSAKGSIPLDYTQELLDDIDSLKQHFAEWYDRGKDAETASSMARSRFIAGLMLEWQESS